MIPRENPQTPQNLLKVEGYLHLDKNGQTARLSLNDGALTVDNLTLSPTSRLTHAPTSTLASRSPPRINISPSSRLSAQKSSRLSTSPTRKRFNLSSEKPSLSGTIKSHTPKHDSVLNRTFDILEYDDYISTENLYTTPLNSLVMQIFNSVTAVLL